MMILVNLVFSQVCEMDQNVERHKLIRDSQELELSALKSRLTEVESLPGSWELRAVANFEGQVARLKLPLPSMRVIYVYC